MTTWLHIVKGAKKLDRKRLLRFALESILNETLKDRMIDGRIPQDELSILPPATYKAVERMANILPSIHDNFSHAAQVTREIAKVAGIQETPTGIPRDAQLSQINECGRLRVEAESWYSLGKCLINAFSKLYSIPTRFKTYFQGG
jgi:hypothetical protein